MACFNGNLTGDLSFNTRDTEYILMSPSVQLLMRSARIPKTAYENYE